MVRQPGGAGLGVLDDTLNELEVTDTEFRELSYFLPLSRELARRALEGDPRRVLLAGLDGLLLNALERVGLECAVADAEGRLPASAYGSFDRVVVVFPERPENPSRLVWRLAQHLSEDGTLIVALRRPRRRRLWAAASQQTAPRDFALDGLSSWSRAAGMRIVEAAPIMATQAWRSGKPLPLRAWLRAGAGHLARRTLPSLRNCLVVSMRRAGTQTRPAQRSRGSG